MELHLGVVGVFDDEGAQDGEGFLGLSGGVEGLGAGELGVWGPPRISNE
ncbi:MAG: hypothetical protein U0232_17995 [Thermomicrobiales bacterium]